ncbi:MAG TPA: peptidoglycan-binding domain-containing protein, partial [Polyangia bacterium]|nr:peptidoglycan-binding domain-containing protein [Polyangia bacterium]
GFSPQLNNQIRPSAAGNSEQLSSVQASLAAGGLYTGPIDGINSAALRASISEYQQLQSLPATGNLDAETVARLERAPSTGVASNGAASTSGTPSTASGFSSSMGLLPAGVPSAGSGTPVITSEPFPLSVHVNMSPFPPAGTTMQP